MENAESYFSIPNAGLVLVMLNFRLAPPELLTILADAGVSALMVHEGFLDALNQIRNQLGFVRHFILIGNISPPDGWHSYERLIEASPSDEPLVDLNERDLAALMYTSGTTGAPKGCMAIHHNFHYVGQSMSQEMGTRMEDRGIITTPLFHASGEVVLMNGIYSATTTIIMPHWDVMEFMTLVEKYRISTGVLATPMLLYLLNCPNIDDFDLKSLRKVIFAGAPVTPEIFRNAIERFGNIFVHGFGTTETLGSICMLGTGDIAKALALGNTEILGSCGKAYTGMDVEVVDEWDNPVPPDQSGEIRTRGPGMTEGYWQKTTETRKVFRDGWFYTGDLCRVDRNGFMYIVGRKKDVIITGAENVYPVEVENVLHKHPDVFDASVTGLANSNWGEIVTAFVVTQANSRITAEQLISFCREEIAGYKVPKKIYFVDSLPRSATGKVLKYKLKEKYAS